MADNQNNIATTETTEGMQVLSKKELKQREKEQVKAIKKQGIKERKIRRAMRTRRLRPLKNFFWWLSGLISSFVLVAIAVFVCVGIVPIGAYFGNDKDKVSEKVATKSLLQIIQNIDDYQVKDLNFLTDMVNDAIASAGITNYVTIDTEAIGELQFVYTEEGKNIGSELLKCVYLSPTVLDDLTPEGAAKPLSQTLGLFEFKALSDKEMDALDPTAEGFQPKLYYYKLENVTLSVTTDDGEFERAYDDEGNLVPEASGKDLYYVSLSDVPVGDVMSLIGVRIGTVPLKQLMTIFGASLDGTMVGDILGDTTITGLSSISPETIMLSTVLPYEQQKIVGGQPVYEGGQPVMIPANEQLYEILCSAISGDTTPKITPEEITVAHLDGLNISNLEINTIIDETAETQILFDILRDLGKLEETDPVTVGDLAGIDFNEVRLSTLLGSGNEFIDILYQAITPKSGHAITSSADLTLGHLINPAYATMDMGDVKLTSVLPYEQKTEGGQPVYEDDGVTPVMTNQAIYDILSAGLGGTSVNNIAINNLSSFNLQTIAISKILTEDTGNAILDELRKDDSVTIANIGTKLNSLDISLLMSGEVFVEKVGGLYTRVQEMDGDVVVKTFYVLTSKAEYIPTGSEYETKDGFAINGADKNSLFVLYRFDKKYDGTDFGTSENKYDDNGNAIIYTQRTGQIGQITSYMTGISTDMFNAKIQQLIDAGIVDGTDINPEMKKMSIEEALEYASGFLSQQ